jgi:hypothetical protein
MEEAMNKVLADGVGALNGFFAAVIILIGFLAGIHGGTPEAVVTCTIIGFLVAVMLCGLIALFVDIRNELVRIRKGDANAATGSGYAPNSIAAAIRGNTGSSQWKTVAAGK